MTQAVPSETEAVTTPAYLSGPVTLAGVVNDVLHWLGLGPLAAFNPLPEAPLPAPLESLWLVVRRFGYTFFNQQPSAHPTITKQDMETAVITGKLGVVDYDDDHVTYTVTCKPAHGAVTVDAAGNFTYTPADDFAKTGGLDSFTVTIDDQPGNPPHIHGPLGLLGLSPAPSVTVQLTVLKINHAPVAGPPGTPTIDHAKGVVTGTLGFTDEDNDPLTYDGEAPDPSGLVIINPDGTYTYTPTLAARLHAATTSEVETATFTVTASDGRAQASTTITVPIDPVSLVVTEVGAVQGIPAGVGVLPDGRTLYVSDGRTVSLVDTATHSVFTNAVAGGPSGLVMSPDGTHMYVANSADHTLWSIDVSGQVGVAPTVVAIPVGQDPGAVAITPDGTLVYVTDASDDTVRVINTATNTVIATVDVGAFPTGVAVNPDGTVAYVANADDDTVSVINTTTNTVSATIDVGQQPVAVVFNKTGTLAYVANANSGFTGSISLIDTATNTVVATLTDVGDGPTDLALSPDGSVLYVANDTGIALIDTTTNTPIITIGVGDRPQSLTVSPDGIYVGTFNGTIQLLAPDVDV